jgi:5'-3' exonuclease
MASFGMEDFAKKFGNLEPAQFVDIIALAGDKSDNIPGVDGIGNVHAVELISRFGTLENLLQSVDEIKEGKIKESLIASADQAILSKKLVGFPVFLSYFHSFIQLLSSQGRDDELC